PALPAPARSELVELGEGPGARGLRVPLDALSCTLFGAGLVTPPRTHTSCHPQPHGDSAGPTIIPAPSTQRTRTPKPTASPRAGLARHNGRRTKSVSGLCGGHGASMLVATRAENEPRRREAEFQTATHRNVVISVAREGICGRRLPRAETRRLAV